MICKYNSIIGRKGATKEFIVLRPYEFMFEKETFK